MTEHDETIVENPFALATVRAAALARQQPQQVTFPDIPKRAFATRREQKLYANAREHVLAQGFVEIKNAVALGQITRLEQAASIHFTRTATNIFHRSHDPSLPPGLQKYLGLFADAQIKRLGIALILTVDHAERSISEIAALDPRPPEREPTLFEKIFGS